MTRDEEIIKNKIGLLKLAEELGNVSRACKVMGFSRDTFYRYRQAVEDGGPEALVEKSRRKPNLKNRTPPEVEAAARAHSPLLETAQVEADMERPVQCCRVVFSHFAC